MAKGDYKSRQPRKPRAPSDQDRLLAALRACVAEMATIEDTGCDHSVGVCMCGWREALTNACRLIAAHDRSSKFIAELEA